MCVHFELCDIKLSLPKDNSKFSEKVSEWVDVVVRIFWLQLLFLQQIWAAILLFKGCIHSFTHLLIILSNYATATCPWL